MPARPQDTALIVHCQAEFRDNQYFVSGTFQCQLSPTFDVHELDNLVCSIESVGQDFKRQLTPTVLATADARVAAVALRANRNFRKHGTRPFSIVARYGEVPFQRQRLASLQFFTV